MTVVLHPKNATHIVTLDLNNLVWRSSEGLRKFRTSRGDKSGHVYGVLSALLSAYNRFYDQQLAFVVALEGRRPQHRLDLLPEYKQNRGKSNKKQDEVFDVVNMLSALPVSFAWNKQYEADDVIASVVKNFPAASHVVVSTDHDMFALVNDHVSVLYKKDMMDLGKVEKKLGFPPSLLPFHKALYGDKSDNIPSVKGLRKARTWPKIVRASKDIGWKHKILARVYREGIKALDLELIAERAGIRAELEPCFEEIRRNHAVVKLQTPNVFLSASPDLRRADHWLKFWEMRRYKDQLLGMFHTLNEQPFVDYIGEDS